jgi:hypothetical protein
MKLNKSKELPEQLKLININDSCNQTKIITQERFNICNKIKYLERFKIKN